MHNSHGTGRITYGIVPVARHEVVHGAIIMEDTNTLDLVVRYANGESVQNLERETGISRDRIISIFAAVGLKLRSRSEAAALCHGGGRYDDLDWPGIVRRYRSGETIKSIGVSLGLVDTQTLRKRLYELVEPRSRGETARLTFTKPIVNLDALAARHAAGETLFSLAREIGVKGETLQRRFLAAGHEVRTGRDRRWRRQLPVDELVTKYNAGTSVLELSRTYKADRGGIALRLVAAGVVLRGYDANGNRRNGETRAATRQAKGLAITPAEQTLADALRNAGTQVTQQTPCGTFNLDITLDGRPVAVEVEGGPAFRYPQCVALWERTKHVLDAGWFVLYVVTDYKPVEHQRVIEQVVAFANFAGRHPTPGGQYGVVRRDGKAGSLGRYDLHGLPRVPGF